MTSNVDIAYTYDWDDPFSPLSRAIPVIMQHTVQQIIDSALQLSPEQRAAVVSAIQQSLPRTDTDHGPHEPQDQVATAWDAEIAKRIADVESGRISTIPSEEAWKMIRGEKPLSF